MDEHQEQMHAFVALGDFFRNYCEYANDSDRVVDDPEHPFHQLDNAITLSGHKNGWFTRENVLFALAQWGRQLTKEALEEWTVAYDLKKNRPKTVALIMAGNIPLTGFHDLMAVLLTGNSALVKLSSNDSVLIPFIVEKLARSAPSLANKVTFAEGPLKGFDAVIATGSNNTARYFEYYFGKVPHIIRKNRNSVAVLSGKESGDDLHALGEDIFRYFGLGCRSVSKLFVPKGYDLDVFFKAIHSYGPIIDHVKYANNYDYNKAVYLMSDYRIWDNGFLILKSDKGYASPIAALFFEEYAELDTLKNRLRNDSEHLQCVIGKGIMDNEVPFGSAQSPLLTDYADGVDTVGFLLKI